VPRTDRTCFSALVFQPQEIPMKLTLKPTKPRNPFVVASLRRAAGAHRTHANAQRQQAGRDLQRELQQLRHSP
jgi:hypothetical protein